MYEQRILTQRISPFTSSRELGFFPKRMGVITGINQYFIKNGSSAKEPSIWLMVGNATSVTRLVYEEEQPGDFGVIDMVPNRLYPIVATGIVGTAVINGVTFTTTFPDPPAYVYWYGGQ